MTLLRRMAQLVEDLRTLNVIKENDGVEFKQYDDGSVDLKISFYNKSHEHPSSDSRSIKNSLEKEFGTSIDIIDRDVDSVYCKSLPE